jgi:hypothetical protein
VNVWQIMAVVVLEEDSDQDAISMLIVGIVFSNAR